MSTPLVSRSLAHLSLPAVSFSDGGTTFLILFDRKTHLPAAIRTRDDDNSMADSNYDLVLADWKAVNGAQIAQSLSYRIGNVQVAKLNYRDVTANPDIASDTFSVPDSVKQRPNRWRPATCPISGSSGGFF